MSEPVIAAELMEPADLWAEITAQPRPHRTMDFPAVSAKTGKPYQVTMVVLSQEECMAASANAEKLARRLLKDEKGNMPSKGEMSEGYTTLYNTQSSLEILWRSCKHPGDPTLKRPFFASKESIGSLTTDQIGILMKHYYTLQSELGPIVSLQSDEELEAWIGTLAKAGNMFPLDSLSWGSLMTLVGFLVRRAYSSQTDSSSSGSPHEKSGSGETPSDPANEPTG